MALRILNATVNILIKHMIQTKEHANHALVKVSVPTGHAHVDKNFHSTRQFPKVNKQKRLKDKQSMVVKEELFPTAVCWMGQIDLKQG